MAAGEVDSFDEFLKLNQHLIDSQLLFNYYSKESINTKDAKETLVTIVTPSP